ncbi:MAG: histidine kinase [Rhodobacteraceae bacterium]|nr:histidine kinase [Paracoccaceae bacterium]
MNGKYIAGILVVAALLAGAAVYYLQVYAFYDEVEPASAAAVIRLTSVTGAAEPMLTEGFEGIDADSSPLRFRGCFTTPMTLAMLTETYALYERPTPLIAPNWFTCFDAGRIGDDLASGTALAFLSEKDIHPGVDRVVAVYPDGRAYAWQQLNESADQ